MPLDHTSEDHQLVEAFLDGDQSAFNIIVDRYRRIVYAVAYRIIHNHEEADDIAQETFIKAYEKLHTFRGEASLKTWLLRITNNLSINLIHSGRISKDSGGELDENMKISEDDLLSGMLENEQKTALKRAITKLPPKQQQTLLLRTYQQLSCKEVANIMNCSVGTVKANVFNGLKRLKSLLCAVEV